MKHEHVATILHDSITMRHPATLSIHRWHALPSPVTWPVTRANRIPDKRTKSTHSYSNCKPMGVRWLTCYYWTCWLLFLLRPSQGMNRENDVHLKPAFCVTCSPSRTWSLLHQTTNTTSLNSDPLAEAVESTKQFLLTLHSDEQSISYN